MILEDARPAAELAIKLLREQAVSLNLANLRVDSLSSFLERAKTTRLSRTDKEIICEQAIVVLDQFYVHLPFKKARYAVDPVQRLRLLHAQLSQSYDDLRFHLEMLNIFSEMRDAHTFYGLPSPYRGAMAFLPFFMQSYFDKNGQRKYIVTNVLTGFDHQHFQPGVEIIRWNGVPIEQAVQRLSHEVPAGNSASKLLRGMMRMTVRSLTYSLPPDEEMTFIEYVSQQNEGAAEARVLVLPWYVATGVTSEQMQFRATAICDPVADHASARELLWGQREWREQEELHEREIAIANSRQRLGVAAIFRSLAEVPASLREDEALFSKLPAIFDFQHPSGLAVEGSITPDELCDGFRDGAKRFGYIRIKSFGEYPDNIFQEFLRILTLMNEYAPDGVIIDVRSNPGGNIIGAERLLQLLTPKEIVPASFHFANTPAIQEILYRINNYTSADSGDFLQMLKLKTDFASWLKDGLNEIASGKLITDGHPLTGNAIANDTGQIYQSPVALLIDSASYSATDIFSGGFQDHGIGVVIGVDENTGGGGACRWLHTDDLFEKLKALPGTPVRALPVDASIGFAVLRSSRVGRFGGYPLEDVGVKHDILHRLTKKDLMDWGSDLVRFACDQLSARPVYRLEIISVEQVTEGLKVTVRTKNLNRLICYLDELPRMVVNASEDSFVIPLQSEERNAELLTLRGHAMLENKLELAAAVRFRLKAARS